MLQRCFPSKMAGWRAKLQQMIPSFGSEGGLNSDAAKARENMAYTAEVLELWGAEAAAKARPAEAEKAFATAHKASAETQEAAAAAAIEAASKAYPVELV